MTTSEMPAVPEGCRCEHEAAGGFVWVRLFETRGTREAEIGTSVGAATPCGCWFSLATSERRAVLAVSLTRQMWPWPTPYRERVALRIGRAPGSLERGRGGAPATRPRPGTGSGHRRPAAA